MVFQALERGAPANVLAEAKLRAQIVSGQLPAGSKLPTERELSAQLGISRLTLRSALSTLAAQGLVSARQGSGYLVMPLAEHGGTELLPDILAAQKGRLRTSELRELLRVRRHLAVAVLESLASHPPNPAARSAIGNAIDEFASACAEPQSRAAARRQPEPALLLLAQRDLAIVRELFLATNSQILCVCWNPISKVLLSDQQLVAAMYRQPSENLVGWRAVEKWLAAPEVKTITSLAAYLAAADERTLAAFARGASR